MGRLCLFPSLSVSLVLLLLTAPVLWLFLSFCISFFNLALQRRAPNHHIQIVALQTTNSLFGEVLKNSGWSRCSFESPLFVFSCRNDAIQDLKLGWFPPGSIMSQPVKNCFDILCQTVPIHDWALCCTLGWSSPQGVVKGSLHLAGEWMDFGVQPKPN